MRSLIVLLALSVPVTAMSADLSPVPVAETEKVTAERIVERPRRVHVVRTTVMPCIKCRGSGLPWGGLRPTYKVSLPWGGLPDYCPPVQAVRRAVVVVKG